MRAEWIQGEQEAGDCNILGKIYQDSSEGTLKAEMINFATRCHVGYDRKRGVEDDSNDLLESPEGWN